MSIQATSEVVPAPGGADERRARIGSTVGSGWVLEEIIGSGGMATVYAAHNAAGEQAAVKVVHRQVLGDDQLVDGFLREIALHDRLDIDGIVHGVESGETDDGLPFFVMERLTGFNVEELRRDADRPLPVREAFLVAIDALQSVHALHEQGVIHRDIKPANLFVCDDGRVCVLDLGIALLVEEGGVEDDDVTARLGTPAYMPPEQAVNATLGVDPRSDVFAMGASLWVLLSGQRMRPAQSLEDEFVLAATTPPPSLARAAAHLPPPVIRVVDRALAWNPNDRWPSAAAMAEALREALDATGDEASHLSDQMRRESLRASIAVFAQSDGAFIDVDALHAARREVRTFFRTLAGLLGVVQRRGWDDPHSESTFQQMRTELDHLMAHLGGALWWTLRPYSFEFAGDSAWEPDSSFDDIPYFLFQSGFRTLRINAGVNDGELTSLVNLFLTDPVVELPPEDDLGTVFVERGFRHITATLLTSFDMSLLDEVEDLQAQLAELRDAVSDGIDDEREALAELVALSQDVGTQGAVEADALDVRVRALQEAAWAAPDDPWWRAAVDEALARDGDDGLDERTRRVLAVAVLEADRHGDRDLVLEPLIERLARLTDGRQARELTDLVYEVVAAFEPDRRAALIADLLDDAAMAMLIGRAATDPELAADRRVQTLVSHAPVQRFATVLAGFVRHPEADTSSIVAPWLLRHTAGNEAHIADALPRAPRVAAEHLLGALGRNPSAAAIAAARAAALNPDGEVRVLALRVRIAMGDAAISEALGHLLRDDTAETRLATIELVRASNVQAAAQTLEHVVREERFHGLPLSERQRLLMALFHLAPRVAEDIAIGLLPPRALMADRGEEASRKLIAELLGTMARSDTAAAALDREARRLIRNSREFRQVAEQAAAQVRERRQGRA